jgi:hypothetical protein
MSQPPGLSRWIELVSHSIRSGPATRSSRRLIWPQTQVRHRWAWTPNDECPGVTCWGAVHGFAMLPVNGPSRGRDRGVRDEALAGLLDTIDEGLGGPPIATIEPA